MSAGPGNLTHVALPEDIAAQLKASAEEMGVDLATYLVFLQQCRLGRLDAKAQDATKFMLRHHDASLRELAR